VFLLESDRRKKILSGEKIAQFFCDERYFKWTADTFEVILESIMHNDLMGKWESMFT